MNFWGCLILSHTPSVSLYFHDTLFVYWITDDVMQLMRITLYGENGFSMENYPKMALIFEWNWWYHLQICMSSRNVIIPCIQPEFQALFLSLSLSLSSFHHYNPGRPQKNYSHHTRKSTTKPIDWPCPGTMLLSNLLSVIKLNTFWLGELQRIDT